MNFTEIDLQQEQELAPIMETDYEIIDPLEEK